MKLSNTNAHAHNMANLTAGLMLWDMYLNKDCSTIWPSQNDPNPRSWLCMSLFKMLFMQPLQKPRNGFVDCTLLSCPGMSTVVARHQTGFIYHHVEHTASGIEDLPACVNCQARLPFGVSTEHRSVKAILQWIWIIADVTNRACFS